MKTLLHNHSDKKQVASSFRHLLLVVVLSIGALSFTACSSSSDSSSNPLNAVLEFSPYEDGVYIYWNVSDSLFASQNITSVNITTIGYDSEGEQQDQETRIVTLEQLTQVRANGNNGFNFENLQSGLEYAFEFSIRIGERPFTRIGITPAEANRADYRGDRRIGVGRDADGNQIADFVDEKLAPPPETPDKDGDGVPNAEDIDEDGDGLIEITEIRNDPNFASFASLENMRMDGSGLTNATMESEQGCGNGKDITVCSGYELSRNLSFSSFALWQPIGDDANLTDRLCLGDGAFTAIFEGNDFTIRGLSILASNSDCVGLFAQLDGAEVRNLKIHATRITGGKNVGVLAGWAQDTLIENVHTKVERLRGVQAVGGLVGRIQLDDGEQAVAAATASGAALPVTVEPTTTANIKDSSAKSEQIRACASAGGLVGESDRIMIQNSYAIAKKIELPFDEARETGLLSFACDSIRATFIASGSPSPVTHHIYKGVGGLVGDGDSSLWQGNQWSSHPNLEEHIVVNIGDYTVEGNTKYPNDGSSTSTYGDLNLTRIVEGGTRIVSSYAISGELIGNWKIGGFLGEGSNSVIESSFAVSKDIHAKIRTAGGLIAQADNTNISASYAIAKEINAAGSNTGAADGDKANGEAGGLIGRARVINVRSSYAMAQSIHSGEVDRGDGLGSAGGLIGSRINKDPDNKIDILLQNSYAVFGDITGEEKRPLVGRENLPTNVEIIDSYWDTNATFVGASQIVGGTNRFYQLNNSENPHAKLTVSLQTGRDVIGAWSRGEPPLDSTSDIFANWREVDCAGGGRIWDLGSETDRKYPAINCTPDDLTGQRAWSYLSSERIIVVNTTLIDERIDAELN